MSSYLIIPEAQRNANTMAPGVVINHAKIEKFLLVNFPAERMGLRNMMMIHTMDSIVAILKSEGKKNVELVSGSETSSDDNSSPGNRGAVHLE